MDLIRFISRFLAVVTLFLITWSSSDAQLVQDVAWAGTQPNKSRIAIVLIHGIQPFAKGFEVSSAKGREMWDQLVNDQWGIDFSHDRLFRDQAVVYRFGYDYRSTTVVNSGYLKVFIDGLVLASDPDAKIVLVCHSNGGLVARHYIEQRDGEKHLARLITLGTPHDGTPLADLSWKLPGSSLPFIQTVAGAAIVAFGFDMSGLNGLQWDDLPLSFDTTINYTLQQRNRQLSGRSSDLLSRYYLIGGDLPPGGLGLGISADLMRRAFRSDGVVPLMSARLEGIRNTEITRVTIPDVGHSSFVSNDVSRLLVKGLVRQAVVAELSRRNPPPSGTGNPSSGSGGSHPEWSLQSGPPGSSVGTVVSESNRATGEGAPGCWLAGDPKFFWGPFGVGDGDHMIYTYTNGKKSGNRAVYTPVLPEGGFYEVKAFVPRLHGTSTDVRYTIVHADGVSVAYVNQLEVSDAFVSLGKYRFDSGTAAHVTVDDYSSKHAYGVKKIAIDTIKFDRAELPPELQPGDALPAQELQTFFHTAGGLKKDLVWKDGGTTKGQANKRHRALVYLDETGEQIADSGWLPNSTPSIIWNVTLPKAGRFRWRVSSSSGAASSPDAVSSWAYSYAGNIPYPTISGFEATGLSYRIVELGFHTDAKGFDGFELSRSTNGGLYTPIAYIGESRESQIDPDVLPQTSYQYRIRMYREDGTQSEPYFSSVIRTPPPPPPVPERLTATFAPAAPTSGAHIHLSWNASSNARTYTVWRQVGGDNPYSFFTGEATSLDDYVLTTRTSYTYWVTAEGGGPSSDFSAPSSVTAQQIVGPQNDDISAAIDLVGPQVQTSVNARFATRGPLDPPISDTGGGASVWYRWQATSNHYVQITAIGDKPLLALYERDVEGNLTRVPEGLHFPEEQRATLWVSVTKGRIYYIGVDDKDGVGIWMGKLFVKQLPDAPDNDMMADAQPIESEVGSWTADVRGARTEPGEPGQGGMHTVWFRYKTLSRRALTLDTFGSDDSTFLEVFARNASTGAFSRVAYNGRSDDGLTATSRLAFLAEAGGDYYIRADYQGSEDEGKGHLRLNWAPTPENDAFANAKLLKGEHGTHVGSNLGATSEFASGETRVLGVGGGSTVWYKFTPSNPGSYVFSTHGTGFDSVLEVFEWTAAGGLKRVVANDDSELGSATSRLTASLSSGRVYYLVVDGKATSLNADTQPAAGVVKVNWIRIGAGAESFVARPGNKVITLDWSEEGADEYLLLRDGQSLTATTARKFSDTGVTVGRSYQYSLNMRFGDLKVSAGPPVGSVPLDLPSPPDQASVTILSSTSIQVQWSALPSGTKAKVLRSVNGRPFIKLVTENSKTVTIDKTVAAGSKYAYRIVAVSPKGESEPRETGYASIPPRVYLERVYVGSSAKPGGTVSGGTVVRGHNIKEKVTIKFSSSSSDVTCSPATITYMDSTLDDSSRTLPFVLKIKAKAKVGRLVTITATLQNSKAKATFTIVAK